jgi:hypothetical protein
MGILERDAPAIRFADMAEGDLAFDRIAADELRDLGPRARILIMEGAATLVLVEHDAPAVAMRAGMAAALHQACETEADIRRDVGAHPQQFTHSSASLPRPFFADG